MTVDIKRYKRITSTRKDKNLPKSVIKRLPQAFVRLKLLSSKIRSERIIIQIARFNNYNNYQNCKIGAKFKFHSTANLQSLLGSDSV